MKKYLIIIEKTNTGFSAYSPDLHGCIATGANKDETLKNIHEAIDFHLEGMILENIDIPEPETEIDYFEYV